MQLAESLMWPQTRDQQGMVKSAPSRSTSWNKKMCGFIQALLPTLLVQKLIIENGNDWFIFFVMLGKTIFLKWSWCWQKHSIFLELSRYVGSQKKKLKIIRSVFPKQGNRDKEGGDKYQESLLSRKLTSCVAVAIWHFPSSGFPYHFSCCPSFVLRQSVIFVFLI